MGRYRLGFKCNLCYHTTKELYGCTLSHDQKSVQIMLCIRCLRRLGLREKQYDSLQSG
jgi:hypothetical protein